jgi:glycosyltransferase involved in cell wall biosynthesis
MRVLFIHFGPFTVNSVIQAFHFGEEMTDLGVDVTLCGRGDPGVISVVGEPRFRTTNFEHLRGTLREFKQDPQETIICAWTPRERVRKATLGIAEELGAPYVVHLEDNEEYLFASAQRMSYDLMRRLPEKAQDRFSHEDLIHPTRWVELMKGAGGVTVITEELNEFNFGGKPHHVARPGIDSERFRPDLVPPVSREALGIGPDEFVLVYHGTVHYANGHEMLSLYLAVKLLQRRGRKVRLVRLGETEFGGPDPRTFRALMDGVVEIGAVPWRDIAAYLALADAFVQPGAPDDFNRYRLPSKLPEFLAMGRPVVLPHCNIGNDLIDGENALLLERGDATDIADRVEQLIDDPALAQRLGAGARSFALENLSWHDNAVSLVDFYRQVLAAAPQGAVAA